MSTPSPRTEPVITYTLLVPVVAWLIAYFFPGTDVPPEVATAIAGVAWIAGEGFARSKVRTKATLPDPAAVKPPPSAEGLLGR